MMHKKWIESYQYAIKKANTPKNFEFRIKRINLFIGLFFLNGRELFKYNGKGFYHFLEVTYYNFLLIFY